MTTRAGERLARLEAIMERVEGAVATMPERINARMDQSNKDIESRLAKIESRLVTLEIANGGARGARMLVGGLLTSAAALGAVLTYVANWFGLLPR